MGHYVRVENYTEGRSAFLSIVTRHHLKGKDRTELLKRNKRSVMRIQDKDFERVIMIDRHAKGINWGNSMLARYKHYVQGDVVLVLDDDDQFTNFTFMSKLKRIMQEHNPDIIRVKMNHSGNVWPNNNWWNKTDREPKPIGDKGGFSSFIVKNLLWKDLIENSRGGWGGDYRFLKAAWEIREELNIYWWNITLTKTNQQGAGR